MAKKALVVGIDSYKIQPLRCAVNDAKEVTTVLAMPEYGFVTTTLEDEDATSRRIRRAFEALFEGDPDLVIFYFAGHAAATEFGVYLVSIDACDNPDEGVDLEYLSRVIRARSRPDTAVVIILDCCHAGALEFGPSVGVAVTSENLSHFLQLGSKRRVLLAACRDNQYSDEDATRQHGVFTAALLEALTGEAANAGGDVTVGGVYDYVAEAFEAASAQRPTFRGDLDGIVVLGAGLAPLEKRERQILSGEVVELLSSRLPHIREARIRSATDPAAWRNTEYGIVCRDVTELADWTQRQQERFTELKGNPEFAALSAELLEHRKALGSPTTGMCTPMGILSSRIGAGSFGTVWKIAETDVAVKIFHSADLEVEEKVKRFRNGYRAMRKLDHPRIVKVHEYWPCPLSFTMDYINGQDLRDWVASYRTTLEAVELVTLLYDVADTLRHAHARDVKHRDVKPENIIVTWEATTARWRPHLTDFDLSWFSTASVAAESPWGNVFYAAPEQLGKPGSLESRSEAVDIFSIGQLLFFVLTGSDPVPLGLADNVRAMHDRLATWPDPEPARRIIELYEGLTQKTPQLRPDSMEKVCRALLSVATMLLPQQASDLIAVDKLPDVLRFAVTGDLSPSAGNGFHSNAGATLIAIEDERFRSGSPHLDIRFTCFRQPLIDFAPSAKVAKEVIWKRVEGVVEGWSKARAIHGQSDPFNFIIRVEVGSLTRAEAENLQHLIRSVIAAVEKG